MHARAPDAWPVAAVAAALALLSLLVPASIAFDPWAWLVWGREAADLALDTNGGPSWKPLPVAVTTLLSPLGAAAPTAWLFLTRFAGVLSVVLVFTLARRFAGIWAGGLAVVAYLLSPDGGPRMTRLLLEGHSAPIEAALALWAVGSHLDGRRTQALWSLTGLALLRPEAWPFLGLYGLWLWRHDEHRASVVTSFAVLPLLWFGADWWGSGSPWHGADAAQVADDDPVLHRFGDAVERVLKVVVVPVWAGIALVVGILRPRDRTLLALTGLALGWCALVVVMATALGYAALSRFLVPAAALLCVVGAAGLVRGAVRIADERVRGVVIAGAVLASLPLALPRMAGIGTQWDDVQERARLEEDLFSVLADADAAGLARTCDEVVVDPTGLSGPAVAWELDLSLDDVRGGADEGAQVAIVLVGGPEHRALSTDPAAVERAVGEGWVLYTIDCGPAST